jgi:hypothetical protein
MLYHKIVLLLVCCPSVLYTNNTLTPAQETYKKHLVWHMLGASIIPATLGTFAVTLLDSVMHKETYPGNESIKWWLTYLVGGGFGTFYALCQETWQELGGAHKAYYILRLIVYYAAIKSSYAVLKRPEIQQYLIDDIIEEPVIPHVKNLKIV